jgi:hypothetical protein
MSSEPQTCLPGALISPNIALRIRVLPNILKNIQVQLLEKQNPAEAFRKMSLDYVC